MIWILAGVVLAGRYRTLWCCLFRPAAMAVRLANWLRGDGTDRWRPGAGGLLYDHGDHPRGPGDDCGESADPQSVGTYTVAFTIPLAIFMGIYIRYLRPGRIGEVSVIGLVMLVFAIISGGWVAESPTWAPWFDYTGVQLTWILVGYGFVAAVLPVWLLLAPRDYLSTFLKIGTIVGLAIGILIMRPTLTMPALTKFVDGTGPVWTGNLFPFLFITIACGAVSGFHALISSGTTPKMLANESQACFIGYGGMLMESFVAIMALVAACIIDPGVYFAMNSPMAVLAPAGTTDVVASAAQVVSGWGFSITPDTLHQIASEVGEQSIISRAGGAPTLAVGMAYILHGSLGGLMDVSFWYHFAILFEALFILTAVDAGTRAARFMLQDLLGVISPGLKKPARYRPTCWRQRCACWLGATSCIRGGRSAGRD